MSGRPKRGPAGPEEEREQLRELTRELHEAAQAAMDAARELRRERAALGAGVEEHMGALVDERLNLITRLVDENRDAVAAYMASAAVELSGYFSRLLGLSTPGDLAAHMSREFLAVLLDDGFMDELADRVAARWRGETRRPGGRVMVATAEDLAAFTAAGGDPGIVIDAR